MVNNGFRRKFCPNASVDAPCKDCEERSLGCHSKCSKYAEYQEKLESVKGARRKELEKFGYISLATLKAPDHMYK